MPLLPRLTLSLLAALLAFLTLYTVDAARRLDGAFYRAKLPTGQHAGANVVVVDIDPRSLAELGARSGFLDRAHHARAIANALAAGATAVAIDVMFEERRSPEGDQQLAELAAREKSIVFSYLAREGGPPGAGLYPALMAAQPRVGYVNAYLDETNGWVAVLPDIPGHRSLALATAELHCARMQPRCAPRLRSGRGNMHYEFGLHPASGVHFHQPVAHFPRLSFLELLEGQPGLLQGKVVLIAPTAPQLRDWHRTPMKQDHWQPGSIVLAYAIETAIHGQSVRWLHPVTLVILLAAFNFALLTWGARHRRAARWLPLIALASLAAAHLLVFEAALLYLPPVVLLVDTVLLGVAAWIFTRRPAASQP